MPSHAMPSHALPSRALPSQPMPPRHSASRRRFLRNAALASSGAALAGPLGLAGRALAQDTGMLPGHLRAIMPGYEVPGMPRGVNLSFGSDDLTQRTATWLTSDRDTQTVVRWTTVGATTEVDDIDPDRDLTRSQAGTSQRAPFGNGDVEDILNPIRDNPDEPHEGEREVFVHRATMSQVAPGGRSAYQVGGDGQWSDVRIFHGGPAAGQAYRFTHFGDHGIAAGAVRANRAIRDLAPDWHLIAGDISYANGDQRIWDAWADQYSATGGTIPTMAAPGNHEAKDFMGEAYRARFSFPNHGASYYSWVHGNVFLISTPAGAFFGDVDGAMEDIQHELLWMEQTLARAALLRATGQVDFIIVTQHFPSYTDHRTRGPISPDRVVVAEQILQRYQVDLLLVGHDHMYQRSHPMAFGVPTSAAALHGVVGDVAALIGLPYSPATTGPQRYANATGYIEVIAGSGGKGLYEFTEVDTLDATIDPEQPFQRHMPWLAASAREQCIVTYDVEGEEMHVTGHLFFDGNNERVGDGIPDNAPGEPGDVDADGNRRPIRFDPDRSPEPFDRFTLVRKPYAAEVPTTPRPAAQVLANLPEAFGSLRYDRSEDCTLHDH